MTAYSIHPFTPHPQRLSTHEKRLLRLRRSIARLEERAIGDRPWELMGEAKARDRPMNR